MRRLVEAARPICLTVVGVIGALVLQTGFSAQADAARSGLEILHTYATSNAWEISSGITLSAASLRPLLPAGYQPFPASALGFGGADQGIVAIVNFQGLQPTIDQRPSGADDQIAIDVGIVVAEPAEAALINANVPGAFHIYALTIYTNDARYAASLEGSGIPVEYVRGITYDRQITDATGIGQVAVNVPSHDAPFHSALNGFGYQPRSGPLNAVFWHQDQRGTAALHVHDEPYLQGQGFSQVYLRPDSPLGMLALGGGLGPCPAGPDPRFGCVNAAALNFRYPRGTHVELDLITE